MTAHRLPTPQHAAGLGVFSQPVSDLLRPFPVILVGLVLAGCSDAAGLREDADRRLAAPGPLAIARDGEAAASSSPTVAEAIRPLPDPLPLADCLTMAVESNRDLRQQIGQAERARLGIIVARSAVYAPQLSATAARTRESLADAAATRSDAASSTLSLNTNAFGFTIAPTATEAWNGGDGTADATYTTSVGITVSRRLLALHEWARLSAPLTQADRAWAASVNSLALKTRRTVAEAARTFLALQKAEARMRLRESRLAQSKLSLVAVREAVAAGLKAPIEEANAVIEQNQAEADLLADRTEVANARDNLLSMLDRPLGGKVNLLPLQVETIAADLPPLETDRAAILAGHEELLNLRIDLDAALDQRRFQQDNVRPDIAASLAAERRWSGLSPGDIGSPEDVVTFTLRLDMPLDAWAGARAELAIREREVRELRLRIRNRESDLEREVRGLHRRIDRLVTGVDLAQQRLVAERDKFRATEASYQSGRVDNLELTRARQTLDSAEVNLLESRIDLALALRDREVLIPPPDAGNRR